MYVREAKLIDISKVADIHIKAFEGFFLTILGKRFLVIMYTAFLLKKSGIMRVAVSDDDQVVGFAAGTSSPQSYFPSLRKEKWFSFLIAALPGLLKKPFFVIQKLFFAILYKGDAPAELKSAALLSSIAVMPNLSGQSLGKKLLADFEFQVIKDNVTSLYLITDKLGNDAVINFYQKAGYRIDGEFYQNGKRLMLRLIKFF